MSFASSNIDRNTYHGGLSEDQPDGHALSQAICSPPGRVRSVVSPGERLLKDNRTGLLLGIDSQDSCSVRGEAAARLLRHGNKCAWVIYLSHRGGSFQFIADIHLRTSSGKTRRPPPRLDEKSLAERLFIERRRLITLIHRSTSWCQQTHQMPLHGLEITRYSARSLLTIENIEC